MKLRVVVSGQKIISKLVEIDQKKLPNFFKMLVTEFPYVFVFVRELGEKIYIEVSGGVWMFGKIKLA